MKRIIKIILFFFPILLIAQVSLDEYIKLDRLIQENKLDSAEVYLNKFKDNNPYNGYYNYILGIYYFFSGDYDKSLLELKNAQNRGWYYISNYLIAARYTKLHQIDSAIIYLDKYIQTPYGGPSIDKLVGDTNFISLHNEPSFQKLLPPQISDDINDIEGWERDIDFLVNMTYKTHYNPFFKISKEKWENEIKTLKDQLPFLSTEQIIVGLYRIIALMADAHTRVFDWLDQKQRYKSGRLPIKTYVFDDGVYIIETIKKYKGLLGAKIIKINDFSISEIQKNIYSLIPNENEMWCKSEFDHYFINTTLLKGLGIISKTDSIEIIFESKDQVKNIKVASINASNKSEWIDYHQENKTSIPLYLQNIDKAYSYKYFEKEKILYFQLNSVKNIKDNPLDQFCDSLRRFIDPLNLSAFIIDIRLNSGGSSHLNKYILKLLMSDKINQKGKFFTIIGRKTFSAAQNLASDIENYTDVIFVGEPTGSSPNFIGEVNLFTLPFSGFVISSSNVYHQRGLYSSDKRKWIAPHFYVSNKFDDFKDGKDTTLNFIINLIHR